VVQNVALRYHLYSVGYHAFTHTYGTVCTGDIYSRGKVAIYVCEISASFGPIYMITNEYGVLVE
jgi:hypothetical protein